MTIDTDRTRIFVQRAWDGDIVPAHPVKLAREGRTELAEAAFRFLPTRARLDLAGWPDVDIFEH